MKKVLIPVAEEGLDATTLSYAKEFAVTMGAQLQVITVLPYSDLVSHKQIVHFIGVESKAFMDVCEETIAKTVKQLADAGITNVNTAILKGDPASEIIDYADKENCDLILIHTHGMGLIKRFSAGSVANTLVHHANVSVLIVK